MKLPFIQFYPSDFLRDTRPLSLAAKGGWIDMICMLHSAPTRGTMKLPIVNWARIIGAEVEQTERVIDELMLLGVADITKEHDGVKIICRRMEGEFEDRSKNAERQKRFRANGGGDPEKWSAIRVEILKRDDYTCAYCGRKARTVDHIKPRCQGGDESHGNLVAACNKCNNQKSGRTPQQAGMSFWKGFNETVLDKDGERNGERNGEITPNKSETINHNPEDRKTIQGEPPAPAGAVCGERIGVEMPFPEPLNTPEFRAKWEEYTAYRRERRLAALKPVSVRKQWALLASYGLNGALLSVEQTIRNGWQGFFEFRAQGGGNGFGLAKVLDTEGSVRSKAW